MKLQENSVFANRYELQNLLGRGGFSEVWLAKDQWTHLNVAIKVYAPGQGMPEDGMREFCGELAGVYDINHPNLLKPQHVDTCENMPYLIMPYCPNGSCVKMIGAVTEAQMWKIIHDVASGLAYLHEKDLVHQDIKPANVMIDEDGNFLITDFGVSSRARSTLRKSVVASTGGGTTAYMGPERFSQQPAPTKASDIWSFGAMCFEMLEGDVPFGEIGGASQKIGADIPLIGANVSDALKYAITMMLQKETWDRPTAATLVEWSAAPQRIGTGNKVIATMGEHRETDTRKRETVSQSKGNGKVWILVGVLAVVICVLFFMLFGGGTNNREPEVAEQIAMDTVEIVKVDTVKIIEPVVEKPKKNSEKSSQSNKSVSAIASEETDTVPKMEPRNTEPKVFTVKDVTFKMIFVEGGTFQMGSYNGSDGDKPHSVTLSDYYISETEVTESLWLKVMGYCSSYYKGHNLPVAGVTYKDCQNFVRKLSKLLGLKFALPTEAQWEYAARGGNKSRGYVYSGSNSVGNVAWYDDNSSHRPHSVGMKPANELGLYDMSGNVYEWCRDLYDAYPSTPQTDPEGPSCGYGAVVRGGSWNSGASRCRSTTRSHNSTDASCRDCGFRIVLIP